MMHFARLYWPEILILSMGALFIWSLWRTHVNNDEFNILDLIMENGRVSRIGVAFMVTLVVTSWAVVVLAVRNAMTEGIFIGYGAMWVAPIVAKLFAPPPPPQKEP